MKHLCSCILLTFALQCNAEQLSLSQAIELAQQNSPTAQSARHTLKAAEWNYRYYKANYKPWVTLSSQPTLNKQINSITLNNGTSAFIRQNKLQSDIAMQISQNIPFTGGKFTLESQVSRLDEFEDNSTSFNSRPLTIGYQQSIFGYNNLKWDRRIEPLRYAEAQKQYAETCNLIAARTCDYFFNLIMAQNNLQIARTNFATADTLYRMAQGRYQIGIMNENDMLQLEINRLSEETNCLDAEVALEECQRVLLSFLGISQPTRLDLELPTVMPFRQIDVAEATLLALTNGVDPQTLERRLMEGKASLARAKANRGLKADLYMRFGLSQTGETVKQSYSNPLHQEYVSLQINLPLLDWGRGRGQVRLAESNLQIIETENQRSLNDFKLNIQKLVMQYNMQNRKVEIAERTAQQALQRYNVAKHLYISQRSTILDLNTAQQQKDAAWRNYINTLKNFWTLHFTLQSIINIPIEQLN